MDVERYRRVRQAFERVADLPSDERTAALDAECGDDHELREEVLDLLRQDESDGVLNTVTRGAGGVVRLLADAVASDELPERLGHYRVIRELGRGGMGVVYEAEQELPRRRVALKTLPAWNRSPKATALFRHEVQALGRVLHPGVPQVYEVFEDHGVPVLAMELVEGRPLLDAVVSLTRRERVELLIRVADAVQHAHDRGVVHRDLKPANVLVTPAGQPKVLDFGIAALEGLDAQAAGTLPYAPPEQLETGESGVWTDVYGLGALAWHVLCGTPPVAVQGLDVPTAIARKRAPLPRPAVVPAPLGAVLCKALSGSVPDRYPTVDELGADLQRFLDDRRVEALRGSVRAWWTAAARRHRRTAAAALALALGALALTTPLRLAAQTLAAERREAAVSAALAELQASAARLGASHPTVAEGFRALADDPMAAGTGALARAYAWRAAQAEGAERLDLLATAWVTAPDGPVRAEVLGDFAEELAAEEHWRSIQGLLPGLPPASLPHVHFGAAMARWDVAEASRLAPPEVAPLVAVLSHARSLPDPPDPEQLVADGLAVTVGGQRWQAADGRVSVRDAQGERVVEALAARPLALTLADLDGDGVLERYTLTYEDDRLLRAEPPEAPSEPVPEGSSEASTALRMAVLPGRALATGGPGWRHASLRVFRPIDDGLQLAGRIRGKVLTLAWLDDAAEPRLVAVMRAPAATSQPRWTGDILESSLVVARWDGASLFIEAQHELPAGCEDVAARDLDQDGLNDVIVACRYSATRGGLLFRQQADGSLVALRLFGLEPLLGRAGPDDRGFWLRDPRGAWWVGNPDDPPPPPEPQAPPAAVPLPEALPESVAGAWERSERLAALGEERLAAQRFVALGERADRVGTLALFRALELLDGDAGAVDVARRLALRADLGPQATERVTRILRATHDAEGIARLGVRGGWVDALSHTEVLHEDGGSLHPAWEVVAPEAVRFDPLTGALRLDLVSNRGTVVQMPLTWDGTGVRADLDLDIEENDWSAGVRMGLRTPSSSLAVGVGRGGGGPPENHSFGLFCGPTGEGHIEPRGAARATTGLVRLSVSWVRDQGAGASGTLRCALDDWSWSGPAELPEGPLELVVGAFPAKNPIAPRLLGLVRRLAVSGARPNVPARSHVGRAFVLGQADAAAELRRSDRAMDRVLADEAGPGSFGMDADLRRLSEDDVRFLLRTAPQTWLPALRRALGPTGLSRWAEAWDVPVHYGARSADAALLDPALANLDLDRASDRTIAVHRARRLLAVGLAPEAGRLLEGLVHRPEASDAWLLVAALRQARGDEAGAREALQAALDAAPDPIVALDRVQSDRTLRALLDPSIPVPPAVR